MFQLIEGFITPSTCERLIAETFAFKKQFYTEENLAAHRTYISDTTPHRTSHAYAVSFGYVEGFTGPLPTINLESMHTDLTEVTHQVLGMELGLAYDNRALFNVQEYYGGSEAVPKHNDGELLEFTTENGGLQIKKSIRPEQVAVLTLVNDTDGGGTRVHFPDGREEVVRAQAGDLLVFRNDQALHSVDALTGTVKRPDGILRMTVGWRSLGDKTVYSTEAGTNLPLTQKEAEDITEAWYLETWPKQWDALQQAARKAAF